MKILTHGMNNPQNIYMECPVCNCKWIVEDRDDMKHEVISSFSLKKKFVNYAIPCPECDWVMNVGIDPNIYEDGNLVSPYKFIFDRLDWREKYEVSVEDLKYRIY